jgi:phosphoribosylformylglycinamidine cyclo-ligase
VIAARYAQAGVDITAADENVRRIRPLVRSTHGPAVLGDFGAFAGLFHLRDVQDPVLVASTDGVGSKLLLGLEHGRHDVLGRDVVNLSVNDVLTTGARPLFFLDYLAVHALDHAVVEALVAGMAAACRENGCALLGGETAQLPDLYAPRHYDLAGVVVGVVERGAIIDGARVQAGDRIWGLPSTGLHTNGYSLARRILAERGLDIADALLAPHPSYLVDVQPLLPAVKAMAHITGGGLPGNIPRVLPEDVSVELDWGAWPVPAVFEILQRAGHLSFEEMLHVFNLGLGMIVVTEADVDPRSLSPNALEVGRVVPRVAQRVVVLGAPA